jgi:hypothetical protein
MENREQQILSEIKAMMASIRSQLEILDAKMAELQQSVDPQEIDMSPIDLDLADFSEVKAEEVSAEDVGADDDLPFDDVPEPEAEAEVSVPEPAVEESEPESEAEESKPEAEVEESEPETDAVEDVEPVESAVEEDLPVAEEEDDDDDLPIFAEPEVVAPQLRKPKPAVIDTMTDRQAWRTDMPGTPVKDIRSAISLNDRIFFINYLFNEDPMAFQEALTRINQMGSLDEVVEYVASDFPEWNMESDVVYRFMMAVRRRIR